jgi:hypothetical protein
MTVYSAWLNVPQAVVLEATRDIDLALGLTSETPALLIVKANRIVGHRTVVPLEANAGEEQRHAALQKFEEEKTTILAGSRYLDTQQRVLWRLIAGVRSKARRRAGGRFEDVDPVEYIGAELQGLDAIDRRSRNVILFDLLIGASDFVESLTGTRVRLAGVHSRPQIQEPASPQVEKWECKGDPVPKVVNWALSKWGGDVANLPGRSELLQIFREQFGTVRGVSELTMREVRRRLASAAARRGGAPRHRRYSLPGK